jgi:hypothetical protein
MADRKRRGFSAIHTLARVIIFRLMAGRKIFSSALLFYLFAPLLVLLLKLLLHRPGFLDRLSLGRPGILFLLFTRLRVGSVLIASGTAGYQGQEKEE